MRFRCRSTRWLNLVISKHGSQRDLPEDHFPFGEAPLHVGQRVAADQIRFHWCCASGCMSLHPAESMALTRLQLPRLLCYGFLDLHSAFFDLVWHFLLLVGSRSQFPQGVFACKCIREIKCFDVSS